MSCLHEGCLGLFMGTVLVMSHGAPDQVSRTSDLTLPPYVKTLTLGRGSEWRFQPLIIDLDGDGHRDLVATARLADPALSIWFGNGAGGLIPATPTWTSVGYSALATGDINHDNLPDIVSASHFGGVQTLLSQGAGKFTEQTFQGADGYVAAQLADINEDGNLDLVLVGYLKLGVEVYFGDGKGHWQLDERLPEHQPGATMPGRALVVADLNRDGHVDLVAAFQRWGLYIYYGDGRGRFRGGMTAVRPPEQILESLAIGDVNHDGHPDLVVNGTWGTQSPANGPDVYLGDGREGWTEASSGLKVLKYGSAALAVGDLDGDGNLDIVAGGSISDKARDGDGLFWFRGDGHGRWSLVQNSGLPSTRLPIVHGVSVADLDGDGSVEIVALHGGAAGNITIWKQRQEPLASK